MEIDKKKKKKIGYIISIFNHTCIPKSVNQSYKYISPFSVN